MKIQLFFVSLFLFCASFLYARDAELNTYQRELARALKSEKRDSIAVAYCHLGEYYAYRRPDSTQYYCKKGLEYARTDVQEPYLTLLNNLADTYNALGDVDASIRYFLFARKEAKRLKSDDILMSSILTSLGVVYRRKEMPDSTLVYYNEALRLLENHEAYDERTHLLTSMAALYANTARLKEGEYYARAAVEASGQCDDMDMVLYAASTAGSILSLREKYQEAAALLYPALAKAREQRKPKFILKSMVYLLNIFSRMGNNDSINHYVKEAEKVMVELPENSSEVLGYRETLCMVFSRMGRYKESLAIQRQMLSTQGINAQAPIDKLFLRMAHNYVGLEDYKHAAEFYEKAYQTADSLRRTEVDAELSELSMKYENQEKALEIARLTQEQLEQKAKTMQWSIVAAIASFAFLFLVFCYIFRQKRIRKEEELKLAQSYIDGLERERSRLAKELHDGVCNDLLGIGMQMQCMQPTAESKQEVLGLLEQVRGDVRCISHELMPPKFQHVTLAETVESYVERLVIPDSMQLAFSKENDAVEWWQVPEQVAYEVYRILQELLSNIVKHSEATEVKITLSVTKELLTLFITDNGRGSADIAEPGKGIGLTTVRERAKAVGGALAIDIREENQMFKLEVPLSI